MGLINCWTGQQEGLNNLTSTYSPDSIVELTQRTRFVHMTAKRDSAGERMNDEGMIRKSKLDRKRSLMWTKQQTSENELWSIPSSLCSAVIMIHHVRGQTGGWGLGAGGCQWIYKFK